MNMKTCCRCKKEFPATLEYFRKNSRDHNKLTGLCVDCIRESNRKSYHDNKNKKHNIERVKRIYKKYYAENKQSILGYQKKYAENNKDKIKKYLAEYRIEYEKNNRELINATKRKYRKVNKDKVNASRREWHANNPEKIKVIKQRRRSRRNNLLADFTDVQWSECLEYFEHKCAYCGSDENLAQEHFISVKNNGPYTQSNIVPACKSCNSSKQDKDFFEWFYGYEHYSLDRENKILNYLELQGADLIEVFI